MRLIILFFITMFVTLISSITFAKPQIDNGKSVSKESKKEFTDRLIEDNSPHLTEAVVEGVVIVMLMNEGRESKPNIVNDSKYGQVVIPSIGGQKKVTRLDVEKELFGQKLDKVCGNSRSCRSEVEQCVGEYGYIENKRIKRNLHLCVNNL